MPRTPRRAYSDEAELRRVRRVAEETLGLILDPIEQSGSGANLVGLRSPHVLYSERLDSRTHFVQDERYGPNRELGVFTGEDSEQLEMSRDILRGLGVPLSEIGDERVMREQSQTGRVDRGRQRVVMEEAENYSTTVKLSRAIRDVPVWSSSLLLGLTRDKQIGFLQLHWPEIPDPVLEEARRLQYLVAHGWRPPEEEAEVESIEAGIIHSPAVSFVMDIYPAIRVIYAPLEQDGGKKRTLYLDRHGQPVPTPRQSGELPPEPPEQRPVSRDDDGRSVA